MSKFTSLLGPQIDCFLTHKAALGVAYNREKAFLREFDHLAMLEGKDYVSESLTRTYLSVFGERARPNRLTLIRQLSRFLVCDDPRTFVPSTHFLGVRRRRPVIRPLSRDEARRFLDACDCMPPDATFVNRVVHGTALRVLLLAGLRRGELLRLKNQDVDLNQDMLAVQGKYGKNRLVPIAADLAQRLRDYRSIVAEELKSTQPGDAFFPCADSHRPTSQKSLYKSFRRVLHAAGIEHRGRGAGPRLHDLRHSFAVLRLLSWYEADADLGVKLPLLATYLGHIGMTTSQVYLHMTRDLVSEVVRREVSRFGDLITEVAP